MDSAGTTGIKKPSSKAQAKDQNAPVKLEGRAGNFLFMTEEIGEGIDQFIKSKLIVCR